jgi:hypothetical protein
MTVWLITRTPAGRIRARPTTATRDPDETVIETGHTLASAQAALAQYAALGGKASPHPGAPAPGSTARNMETS